MDSFTLRAGLATPHAQMRKDGAGPAGPKAGLNSVAETDFEEQMSELSEENQRLGQKVQEMERKLQVKDRENRELEAKLNAIDRKVAIESCGVGKGEGRGRRGVGRWRKGQGACWGATSCSQASDRAGDHSWVGVGRGKG